MMTGWISWPARLSMSFLKQQAGLECATGYCASFSAGIGGPPTFPSSLILRSAINTVNSCHSHSRTRGSCCCRDHRHRNGHTGNFQKGQQREHRSLVSEGDGNDLLSFGGGVFKILVMGRQHPYTYLRRRPAKSASELLEIDRLVQSARSQHEIVRVVRAEIEGILLLGARGHIELEDTATEAARNLQLVVHSQ